MWEIYWSVGFVFMGASMLMAAAYTVAIRARHEELAFDELIKRREIGRWLLGLASGIWLAAVLSSELLVRWPPSLLVQSQQLALQPIISAVPLLLGAVGTMVLFATACPALAAFTLDVRRYRAKVLRVKATGTEPTSLIVTAKNGEAAGAEDTLAFAAWPTVAGIAATLAPLLVSVLGEALKAIMARF